MNPFHLRLNDSLSISVVVQSIQFQTSSLSLHDLSWILIVFRIHTKLRTRELLKLWAILVRAKREKFNFHLQLQRLNNLQATQIVKNSLIAE